MSRHSNLHKLLGNWFEDSDATARRTNVCNSIGVLAALTMAGLGVSYLPRKHFARDINDGRLQVLDIAPRLPDLEYFAVFEKRQLQPLSRTIAELAQQHSTFRQPRDARGKPRAPHPSVHP